jgi:hypothetical protein
VRPTASLIPLRRVAAISTSTRKDANAVAPLGSGGLVKRREVPLPSEEGTKGVVQYALYVAFISSPEVFRVFFEEFAEASPLLYSG